MTEESTEAQFSPILIMEFIRQVTVAHYLDGKPIAEPVRFKLAKSYYDEIKAYNCKCNLFGFMMNMMKTQRF